MYEDLFAAEGEADRGEVYTSDAIHLCCWLPLLFYGMNTFCGHTQKLTELLQIVDERGRTAPFVYNLQ